MISVRDRERRVEARDRAEDLRWLEETWAASPDAPEPEAEWSDRLGPLRHLRLGPVLLVLWPVFLVVLFTLPPPDPSAAAPLWAEALANGMFLLLLATVGGFAAAWLGFGASGLAAACGSAVAVGCFTAGHTGFWPTFQLAGFVLLAGLSAAGVARSARRARST